MIEHAVLAELFAVVRGDYDDGVLQLSARLQGPEEDAQSGIQVRQGFIVLVDGGPYGFRRPPAGGEVLPHGVDVPGGAGLAEKRIPRGRRLIRIVRVEKVQKGEVRPAGRRSVEPAQELMLDRFGVLPHQGSLSKPVSHEHLAQGGTEQDLSGAGAVVLIVTESPGEPGLLAAVARVGHEPPVTYPRAARASASVG